MERFELYSLADMEMGYAFMRQRTLKKISLRALAKETKMSESALCRFENGKLALSVSKMNRIAECLKFEIKICIVH